AARPDEQRLKLLAALSSAKRLRLAQQFLRSQWCTRTSPGEPAQPSEALSGMAKSKPSALKLGELTSGTAAGAPGGPFSGPPLACSCFCGSAKEIGAAFAGSCSSASSDSISLFRRS